MIKDEVSLLDITPESRLLCKSFHNNKSMQDDDAEISFDVTCYQNLKKGLVVELITSEDGRPIDFSSDFVQTDLYFLRENQSPYIWENVSIKRFYYDDRYVHVIIPSVKGHKLNRRNYFRVSVGLPGIARLGFNRKPADVLVHDISYSGFALVTNKEYEIHLKDSVRITYDDDNQHIVLNGVCIRKKTLSDTRVLYGCLFETRKPQIKDYILKRQTKLIKMQ